MPTELKLLRGNPGKRRINPDEPKPPPASGPPPSWLPASAKREWRRVAPILQRPGLLSQADEDALTTYCCAYARWKAAEQKVDELGLILQGPSGYPMVSPYLTIANKAMAQCQKMLAEFGMTPSARSRVVSAKAPTPDARTARFFGPRPPE